MRNRLCERSRFDQSDSRGALRAQAAGPRSVTPCLFDPTLPCGSLITWTRHPASGCTSLSIPARSKPSVRVCRASLSLLIKIKAIPARTCSARELGLDLLHWKVGRLLSTEDTIGVGGRLPILVGQIRPVRHQAAVGDEESEGVHRGQVVRAGGEPPMALDFRLPSARCWFDCRCCD